MSETKTDKMPCAPTDTGVANFMATLYHNEIKYVLGMGWHRWSGTHWVHNEAAGIQYVQKMIVKMYRMASEMHDADIRKQLVELAASCESAHRIRAIEFLAKNHPKINIRMDAFDADAWLFNCINGTLNLRTSKLNDHNPADLITKCSPVAFDPAAEAPIFLKFFREILGNDDALITYVSRVLGMCLTGDITAQHLWIFYGTGANGKSTLMDVLAYIMGDYFAVAADTLLTSTKGREEHPTERADLQGRRMVLASETEAGAKLKIQLAKRLTGDSTIKARRMGKDFFEFPRTHKLFIMSNNRPRVTEDSEAVWRRIRLVLFMVTIPPERRDAKLLEKLKAEAAGVLNWLVAGCLAWQSDGLTDPAAVNAATAGYRAESDPLADFIADNCQESPDAWSTTKALYAAYCQHTDAAHEKPIIQRQFVDSLSKRPGLRAERRHSGRGWLGIELNTLFTAGA